MDTLERDTAGQPIFPPGTIFHFRDIGLLARSDCQKYWKIDSEVGHEQTRVYNVIAVEGEEAGIEAEKEPTETGPREKRKRTITTESEVLDPIESLAAGSSTSAKTVSTSTSLIPPVNSAKVLASISTTSSSQPYLNLVRGRDGRFTKKKKKDMPVTTAASTASESADLPLTNIMDAPQKVMDEEAVKQPAPASPIEAEVLPKPSFVPRAISPTIAREIKVNYKSSKQYQQAPIMHWETEYLSLQQQSATAGWLECLLPGEKLWTVGLLTGLIMPTDLDDEEVQGQEPESSTPQSQSRKPKNKRASVGVAAQGKHTNAVIVAAIQNGAWLRCPVLLPQGRCYIAQEDGTYVMKVPGRVIDGLHLFTPCPKSHAVGYSLPDHVFGCGWCKQFETRAWTQMISHSDGCCNAGVTCEKSSALDE